MLYELSHKYGLRTEQVPESELPNVLEELKELIRREIRKELKIKEGAEKLREVAADRRSVAAIVKAANGRLSELQAELHELEDKIIMTQGLSQGLQPHHHGHHHALQPPATPPTHHNGRGECRTPRAPPGTALGARSRGERQLSTVCNRPGRVAHGPARRARPLCPHRIARTACQCRVLGSAFEVVRAAG